MIRDFGDKSPKIDPSVLVHETAYILGDVEIGAASSVWPGTVIRGDIAKIKIGRNVHIQDNCVVHTEYGSEIGDNVVIGHAVVVHSSKMGSNVMVGNNATLLDNCEIGSDTIIAAGSVVPPEAKFPEKSMIIGSPARRKEEISQRHLEQIDYSVKWYARMVKLYREKGF
ncbi:MAG TPA: gamma carbonic anhydrase family protein [Dehalococcoidia bacterium]|nr:gamma carbonic anhydrase family protein [Dehalococcoidia bacterium]